jgi:predicted DNA-binding transcriptional regulator YafY
MRGAIRSRQKLRLAYRSPGDGITRRTVRPLQLEYWGRVWTLTAWCEMRGAFRVFRVDRIDRVEILPELFVDEPGRMLADYKAGLPSNG